MAKPTIKNKELPVAYKKSNTKRMKYSCTNMYLGT